MPQRPRDLRLGPPRPAPALRVHLELVNVLLLSQLRNLYPVQNIFIFFPFRFALYRRSCSCFCPRRGVGCPDAWAVLTPGGVPESSRLRPGPHYVLGPATHGTDSSVTTACPPRPPALARGRWVSPTMHVKLVLL